MLEVDAWKDRNYPNKLRATALEHPELGTYDQLQLWEAAHALDSLILLVEGLLSPKNRDSRG